MTIRRSSQADLDAAIAAVVAGASYRAAQEMTGVPASTIQYNVQRWGVVRKSVPRSGPKLRPGASIEHALEALSAGATQLEAAKVAGIGISTLGRCLRGDRVEMSHVRVRPAGALNLSEREEIRVGIEAGESDAAIATRIGRHRSTVWREIAANGGRRRYRAALAEERAAQAARRPKVPWTEERPWLWREVQGLLRTKKWSPEQIARGCAKSTLTSQSGGCPTRPSTRRSSSRPRASCARSSPPACARAGLGGGLGREPPPDERRSSAWSTSPSALRRSKTGPCRATGRVT